MARSRKRVHVVRLVVVEQALEAELVVRCSGLELKFLKCVDDIAYTFEWFTPDERAKCEHFLLGTAILVEDIHLLDDRRLAAERGYPCTQQTPRTAHFTRPHGGIAGAGYSDIGGRSVSMRDAGREQQSPNHGRQLGYKSHCCTAKWRRGIVECLTTAH
jgi:hypothetical protein